METRINWSSKNDILINSNPRVNLHCTWYTITQKKMTNVFDSIITRFCINIDFNTLWNHELLIFIESYCLYLITSHYSKVWLYNLFEITLTHSLINFHGVCRQKLIFTDHQLRIDFIEIKSILLLLLPTQMLKYDL